VADSERRWVDELLPEAEGWARDLIHEELERRDQRITILDAENTHLGEALTNLGDDLAADLEDEARGMGERLAATVREAVREALVTRPASPPRLERTDAEELIETMITLAKQNRAYGRFTLAAEQDAIATRLRAIHPRGGTK
jgi:hypothetical protein